ncbi:MAG: hypothetical protein JWL83_4453 [Actinomycetia bacterium]|nr:hypothetical protein [Actinomycetes bacterium]
MRLAPRYDGPVIISIAGPADDQRVPVMRQRRRLEATLADLSDDDWKSPSRCDLWTVQDVVAHLVGVNGFWQHSVSAGLAGTPTRVLTGFDPAATPPLMVEPMRALTPAEVLEQFVSSNDAFLGTIAELDEPAWSMLAESPAGHVPIRVLAHHALWDSWIHERDIALPLGLHPIVEPDEMMSSLRFAAALSSALAISFGGTCVGAFALEASDPELCFELVVGDSVVVREGPVSSDAPCLRGGAAALVEALSLRTPLPPSAPAEWRELLAGMATAFRAELELS